MNTTPPKAPIGVFDSGYGGLTILQELRKSLPSYDFLYLGDNARSPYGSRSFDVVYKFTLQAVEHLFREGCPLIILACNTASAKALRTLQQEYLPSSKDPSHRLLGVIRPTVEILEQLTHNKHIGILATEGTVSSNSYKNEINKLNPDFIVSQEACPIWVPLVEAGLSHSPGADFFIREHIQRLFQRDSNVDAVVLACTHYPLLLDKINKTIPEVTKQPVAVVAQGSIVASSLVDYLQRHPEMDSRLSKERHIRYLTTEDPEQFARKAKVFLRCAIQAEKVIIDE